jgi:multidrug efflux pump subunit AcrA (membrane-fusion protein)
MNDVKNIAGWIVPALILAAGAAVFLGLGTQPPPPRKEASPSVAQPVRTRPAEAVAEGLSIAADGVVVPLREVTLAAEVPGRVKRKEDVCNEGRFVEAGAVLLEIEPRDYELDVERLERELRQAGLAIEEIDEEFAQNAESTGLARRQVDLARREVARLEGLKAGRIVTESDHDRALRDELTATNSLTMLEGQRRVLTKRRSKMVEAQLLAQTMLEKAKLDLSRTTIRAPVAGIIVEDKVEQGSFVAKGTPLVTIEDTSGAEVRTNLEMADVARIWGGRAASAAGPRPGFDAPATVTFRIGDATYEWDGLLSRQEGRGIDERTRTLTCRVHVADPARVRAMDRYGAALPVVPPEAPRTLLRGMFVQVHVHLDTPDELVSIPEEAQRPNGEVWVMRDGRLEVLRPRAVQSTGGRLVFESRSAGLAAGDRVIVSQIANPRAGMPVAESDPAAEPAARSAAVDSGEDAT